MRAVAEGKKLLKIGIVGCGKIADSHVAQIQRIPDARIVGVCDQEPLMASQLAERFNLPNAFNDLDELLSRGQPDVIHITTPPQSHFDIARLSLEQGCHVYVEKPFTLCQAAAQRLIDLAEKKSLKITAGHDDQFRHVARRMRKLVNEGYLGGPPVHMESYYCYQLEGGDYAKALLADKHHWVRHLRGGLLQNIISHGIARIAEFMTGEELKVIAHGFVSPGLRRRGEKSVVDEVRVIVSGNDGRTAYFTFSSQMRPSLHQFRIYGTKNGLLLDQDNETLIKLRGKKYKLYLEQFVPPLSFAGQYFKNLAVNVRLFLANDFHAKAGMYHLIKLFYDSIARGTPPPIPYQQILTTAFIMDEIFAQVSPARAGGVETGPGPEESTCLSDPAELRQVGVE